MRNVLSLLVTAGLSGCAGQAPPNVADQPDAGVDAPPTSYMLTGTAMDYFGNMPVADAVITTDGLVPELVATSADDGAYALDVAVGSALYVIGWKPNYRLTRNIPLTIGEMPATQDVYLMTEQDVRNQYTAVGATPTEDTAIVIADLRRNNGMPLEGIPLANVQLLDGNNQPVPGILGPYFFNAAGSVDLGELTSTAYGGRARAAFLDVPPGTYTLSVTYLNDQQQDVTSTTPLATLPAGATLARSGGMGGGGGGGGGGNNVPDPSFATDIYPKLQRAGLGGLGCANCHTLSGPGAVLKFDEPAGTVLASITARPGVVNATTPAESLLLVRPLYEPPPTPQDHPNATFLDVNDPDYKLFLLWIQRGAKP